MLKTIFLGLIIFSLGGSFAFAQEEKPVEVKEGFIEKLSFEEGTFFGGINVAVIRLVGKVEFFREAKKVSFRESLDKVDDKRQEDKDAKPASKIFTFLHICLLAILLFIFSLQVAFYVIGGLIVWAVVRRVLRFFFGWMRRREGGS